jgi:hypothetical protein
MERSRSTTLHRQSRSGRAARDRRPPLAEVGWETVYGSGPRGDFHYPVSEVLGSWASFMRGIQL